MVRTAWEDGLGAIGGHSRSQNVCYTHWTLVSVLISMYHRQRSFSRALYYPRFPRSLRLHAALVTPLSGPTARLSEALIVLGPLQKKKWLTRVAAGRTGLGYIDTDPLTLLPTAIAAHPDGNHSQLPGKAEHSKVLQIEVEFYYPGQHRTSGKVSCTVDNPVHRLESSGPEELGQGMGTPLPRVS